MSRKYPKFETRISPEFQELCKSCAFLMSMELSTWIREAMKNQIISQIGQEDYDKNIKAENKAIRKNPSDSTIKIGPQRPSAVRSTDGHTSRKKSRRSD